MRRTKLAPVLRAGLTAVLMGSLTAAVGGFGSGVESVRGREVIKIVSTRPGPLHAKVTAKGAFRATGYFWRKKASLVFPRGRLAVRRTLASSTVSPPNLATCRFKARQTGTFRVFYATGQYHGLRYSGQFWTNISGRLKKAGHDQCSAKIATYRAVTYEIGTFP